MEGVKDRELGAAARCLGEPKALGEGDGVVRCPVSDQQASPEARNHGEGREGCQGMTGPWRESGQ